MAGKSGRLAPPGCRGAAQGLPIGLQSVAGLGIITALCFLSPIAWKQHVGRPVAARRTRPWSAEFLWLGL